MFYILRIVNQLPQQDLQISSIIIYDGRVYKILVNKEQKDSYCF
jgi:hypothetical protein